MCDLKISGALAGHRKALVTRNFTMVTTAREPTAGNALDDEPEEEETRTHLVANSLVMAARSQVAEKGDCFNYVLYFPQI
jgi:hypothetical protein